MTTPYDPRHGNSRPDRDIYMSGTAYHRSRIYQAGGDQNVTHSGTNATAVMALVSVIVFAPLAIVLGHVAKSQIRRTGEGGSGLATTALVLGYLITVLSLWALIVIVPQFISQYNEFTNIPVPTP
jgi:hypothetical protein